MFRHLIKYSLVNTLSKVLLQPTKILCFLQRSELGIWIFFSWQSPHPPVMPIEQPSPAFSTVLSFLQIHLWPKKGLWTHLKTSGHNNLSSSQNVGFDQNLGFLEFVWVFSFCAPSPLQKKKKCFPHHNLNFLV